MYRILGIDPGSENSAYCEIERSVAGEPQPEWGVRLGQKGKVPNATLRNMIKDGAICSDVLALEIISNSFGSGIGRSVTLTAEWVGRYLATWEDWVGTEIRTYSRSEIKLHFVGKITANDSMIRLALTDRFALGTPNYGKGSKKAPGFFYGVSADIWQSIAVAVVCMDAIYNPWKGMGRIK